MKRKEKLPELLSPAGDFECLVAAVAAGADAIYVGGKRFGARAYAKNFDIEELSRAVSYCHLHGVRLYVTVNTLVFDREMKELVEYAKELYRIGVDALIIADVGAIAEIRRRIPGLELHASTQMSVHNLLGADAAAELGCSRVVLARELSFKDIVSITESSAAEIEVFLHGALCVCHSGQCLFSSLVGGRSGNRGECAQPCRLPYNGKYPLSLKDLSLAGHIKELIDSGVSSLKIEGRMKSPSYVCTVTKIYRRLLDEGRNATESEERLLKQAFSRGGFTDGYFIRKTDSPMTGVRSRTDKNETKELAELKFEPQKIKVRAVAELRLGKPAYLSLVGERRSVSVFGATPRPAESSPLTKEAVAARLSKMGNTYLSLSPEDVELTLDEGINLSPGEINALRRLAAEKFEDFSREEIPSEDFVEKTPPEPTEQNITTALFLNSEEMLRAVRKNAELLDSFSFAFVSLFSSDEALSFARGAYIPPVICESEMGEVEKRLEKMAALGVKNVLVSNIGAVLLAQKFGLTPIGDFRLNITNKYSKNEYRRLGVKQSVLSPELTLPMARDIGGGLIVYGRIPLMITERCFIFENFGCDECGKAVLIDRRGERFPMLREYKHRNLILNSAFTYMGDRKDMLTKNRINASHFIFTTESAEEIISSLFAYKKGLPLSGSVRRIGKREANK